MNDFINKTICGDSLEIMKSMPEECVNLAITSPPYFGCRVYGNETVGREEDPREYIENIFKFTQEIKRVLRNDGSFYLNIGDMYFGTKSGFGFKGFTGKAARKTHRHYVGRTVVDADGKYLQNKQLLQLPPRIAAKMQDDGWILRNCIIWKKKNAMPVPAPDRFLPTYEYIYFFSKSEKYYFNLKESKKSLFKGKDIITVNIQPFKKHDASFPEELIYPMIKISSQTGDIVLDPFGGSGTVASISKRTNRKYVYIDTNKEFCESANMRISETAAGTLANDSDPDPEVRPVCYFDNLV